MLMEKLEKSVDTEELEFDEYNFRSEPFGKNILKVFNCSQAFTGFGAAIGRLKDFGKLASFHVLNSLFSEIVAGGEEQNEWFVELLIGLEKVRAESKKIGNGQRMFFQYFFRELFNSESDSYLNLYHAATNSFQKYRSQV